MAAASSETAAILLAGAAATTFAVANVVQQRVAARLAPSAGFDTRVLLRLVRRPLWVAGLLTVVLSFGLQAAALSSGRMVVTEPILASSLLVALALSAWLDRRQMRRADWTAALMTVAGLTGFLLASQPSGGERVAGTWPLCLAGLAALALAGACAAASVRVPAGRRALILGIGGGAGAGVTDALTKSVTALTVAHGPAILADPRLYLLAVLGLVTFTLQQNGYRAARLAGLLPVFAVLEPIVGCLLGLLIYHEHVAGAPGRIALEALAVALAACGIARLAGSPAVLGALVPAAAPQTETPATSDI